jgi:ribose 5-phosphate isomerase RpiB
LKIAVVTETSTAEKNRDVIEALRRNGYEALNVGTRKAPNEPPLSYVETGFISALLIHLGLADFIVGGCGTGQGYFNAVCQFPGMCCGLIIDPTDAWLFAQINGGNCISLALNKGYGWAGDANLGFVFEKLFSVNFGSGYPEHRQEPQRLARLSLAALSTTTHKTFEQIVECIDRSVLESALSFPGVWDLVQSAGEERATLKRALARRYSAS